MAHRTRVIWQAIAIAAGLLLMASTAGYAQMKKGSHASPPAETKPKVDEKAYEAALDRIPTPKKPYDPWGQVHEGDSAAKPSGRSK